MNNEEAAPLILTSSFEPRTSNLTLPLLPLHLLPPAPRRTARPAAAPSRRKESARSSSPPLPASDCRTARGGSLPRRVPATHRAAAPRSRVAARSFRAAGRPFRNRSCGCGSLRRLRPEALHAERARVDGAVEPSSLQLHFDRIADGDDGGVEDRLASAFGAREGDGVAAREYGERRHGLQRCGGCFEPVARAGDARGERGQRLVRGAEAG